MYAIRSYYGFVSSALKEAFSATIEECSTCLLISEIEDDSSSAAAATVSTLDVACSDAAATDVRITSYNVCYTKLLRYFAFINNVHYPVASVWVCA